MPHQRDAYHAMKWILSRPGIAYPAANNLRDVLAVIQGLALAWFPPHGSGFLPGFPEFVMRKLNTPPVYSHYVALMEKLGDLPYPGACNTILAMLEEWKTTDPAAVKLLRYCGPGLSTEKKDWIVFHLKEAHEELTKFIETITAAPNINAIDFEIALAHMYNHLNTAWNSRNASAEQIAAQTEVDFYSWREYPKDISMGR